MATLRFLISVSEDWRRSKVTLLPLWYKWNITAIVIRCIVSDRGVWCAAQSYLFLYECLYAVMRALSWRSELGKGDGLYCYLKHTSVSFYSYRCLHGFIEEIWMLVGTDIMNIIIWLVSPLPDVISSVNDFTVYPYTYSFIKIKNQQ